MTCLNDKNLASYQKCKAGLVGGVILTWKKKTLSVHIANFPARKWQQINLNRVFPKSVIMRKRNVQRILEVEDAFIEQCITPYTEIIEIYDKQQQIDYHPGSSGNTHNISKTQSTFSVARSSGTNSTEFSRSLSDNNEINNYCLTLLILFDALI